MSDYNVYRDIATRCDGNIYIGVIGPVRTGKSTFIKKFMDTLVIPNINNAFKRERAKDELPQSAAGKTIMTTEPKFIPNEAVEIELGDNAKFKVRMIDCVGYIVDSAMGHIENDAPRMVKTPWSDTEIPFIKAAEIGTKKVITDHSTIGIVVTTDGSIAGIDRQDYIDAENRVISELKEIGKPFVVLVNSVSPESQSAISAKNDIELRHGVSAMTVNCLELTATDINKILEGVLFEFPLKELEINLPDWVDALPYSHRLKKSVYADVLALSKEIKCIRDIRAFASKLKDNENIRDTDIFSISPGRGVASINTEFCEELFYKVLGENCGIEIDGKGTLIKLMSELSETKKKYDKIAYALKEVQETGYGIVSPSIDELSLEEPEIVKQGNRFGVRLRASAPSIHMIRADIETEVSPIVGTEKQSEELVHYLLKEFEVDPKSIWSTNIFGKSLHELVNEGLHNKLYRMPEDAQYKLQETLQRIINEGSGGLICIIL